MRLVNPLEVSVCDLTETNIAHLKYFRAFLKRIIDDVNSPDRVETVDTIKWKCEEYTNHLNALLKDKK